MNSWRTRCPVCKKMRIVKKTIIQPHPNVNNNGKCPGSNFDTSTLRKFFLK